MIPQVVHNIRLEVLLGVKFFASALHKCFLKCLFSFFSHDKFDYK